MATGFYSGEMLLSYHVALLFLAAVRLTCKTFALLVLLKSACSLFEL